MLVLEFAKKICLYVSLLRNPIGYIFQVPYFRNVVATTYLRLEMWHLLKNIFCFCCKLRPASYKTFSKHFQEKKKILLRSLEYLLQSLITCLCASTCKLEEQCTYRGKNTGEQRQNRDVPKSRDYSRRECQGF